MKVTALCITEGDQSSGLKLGKIADEFQNLDTNPYLGTSVVPRPFEEEAGLPGIHLHWTLPDALTRSDPTDGKGFPQVPNRFLVVRLAALLPGPGGTAAALEKKAWVVESDYLWTEGEKGEREERARNAFSRAVPVTEEMAAMGLKHDHAYVYQGRVRALDADWADSGRKSLRRFTALGYGTEAYAAAYPMCRNVFGFFDPLFDSERAPDGLDDRHQHLSYLVIGWYGDVASDPVHQVQNSKTLRMISKDPLGIAELIASDAEVKRRKGFGGYQAILDLMTRDPEVQRAAAIAEAFRTDYRWSYRWVAAVANPASPAVPGRPALPAVPARVARPVRTLFVGQLNAVEWNPDDAHAKPTADPVTVALGTTAVEALSALLASTTGPENAAAIETLLNDIQFDLVRDYATAAGQSGHSDALHAFDFSPVPAGHASAQNDWLFAEGDIKGVKSLIARLQDDRKNKATHPVSQVVWARHLLPWLRNLFPGDASAPATEQERRLLVTLNAMPAGDREKVLILALNAMLQRESIHDATRFNGVSLRPETRSLIAQSPTQGELLMRLNRLLLEDTYPDEFEAHKAGSGRIWLIQRAGSAAPGESLSAARTGDLAEAAAAVGLALPDDLGTALAALNRSQLEFDDLAAAVATRRGQIFADWTQYLAVNDGSTKTYIQNEIHALHDLVKKMGDKREERDRAKGSLRRFLRLPQYTKKARSGMPTPAYDYELDSVAAPRFYQPNDPVILISGLNPSAPPAGDGRAELNCRLSDEITQVNERGSLAMDQRARLDTLCGPLDWAPFVLAALPRPTDMLALCTEACLLHRWMGDLTGSADVAQRQNGYLRKADTHTFRGKAPSPVGLSDHVQPWSPMMLQWETSFSPFQPLCGPDQTPMAYSELWGLQQFGWAPTTPEICYTGAYPGLAGPGSTSYQGTVALTHQLAANLPHQIDRYLQVHPLAPDSDAPAVQHLKRTLKNISGHPFTLAGQSMSGFHGQLRMRNQTLQMRVGAPVPPGIGSDPAQKAKYLELLKRSEFAIEVRAAVGSENDASRLDDRRQYHPLRAGILTLSRLRVLDAFGQVRDLIDPHRQDGTIPPGAVIRSARLNKMPGDWNETGALLPLRIAQPARLTFRYRSASLSTGDTHQARSPIFGWVLFNRFDHALAIYDEEGRPVGAFHTLGPVWQESPGANRGVLNPQLLEFVQHLGGQVPVTPQDPRDGAFRDLLRKLIDTIDDAVAGIEPDSFRQDQGLAVLIGRPLALVLADLRLDLYGSMPGEDSLPGLPAIDQSRAAFDAVKSDPSYVEKHRWSAEFAKVRLPLRLGDGAKAHDGLVGYFVQGRDAAETYRTFFSQSATADGSPGVVAPPITGDERLSLAPADPAAKTVVMLVDPRAAVHANVGILPVKHIALPPALYADALKRIDATFLVAPVLGGAEGVALPVPNEVGHAWSWMTRQADEALFVNEGIGVRKWMAQELVVSPNPRSAFSAPPLRLREGWLHLYPVETFPDAVDEKKPASPPSPYGVVVRPNVNGHVLLGPETARLHGDGIAMAETDTGKRFIGFWTALQDEVTWKTKLDAATWEIHLHRLRIGLGDADDEEVQIEIEVRVSLTAHMIASHRVTFGYGEQHLLAGNFATAQRVDYDIRIKLLNGTFNLERIELAPRL